MSQPLASTGMNVATIENQQHTTQPPPGPPMTTTYFRRYTVKGTLNPLHSRDYDLTPGNETGLAATALNMAMQANYFCYDPLDRHHSEQVHVRNVAELIAADPNKDETPRPPGNQPDADPEVLPTTDE